jgi:hypothetical protein
MYVGDAYLLTTIFATELNYQESSLLYEFWIFLSIPA